MESTTPLALRLEPRSLSALRKIGVEVDRHGKYGAEHPDRPPRINPTRSPGNSTLYGIPASEVYGAVAQAVDRIGLARVTGRDDQPVAAEIVMSVDGAWAAQREQSEPGWRARYVQRCTELLLQEYGAERVLSVTDHADERAPHIHAFVLPIAGIRRGNRYGSSREMKKISYSKVFCPGGRQEFAARWDPTRSTADTTYTGRLQTRFAKALGDLGIVRGERDSSTHRKHMTRDDFYRAILTAQSAVAEELPPTPDAPESLLKEVDARAKELFSPLTSLTSPGEIAKAGFRGGWAHGFTAAMKAARTSPAISRAAERDVERQRRRDADKAVQQARDSEREERRKREMTEDEIRALRARLRTISASSLNEWLGDAYPLEVEIGGRRRRVLTCFDRLMYHGVPDDAGGVRRLSYDAATDWLVEHFPGDVDGIAQSAAATVAVETKAKTTEWLRRRILRDVRAVYDALGVATLRILAIKPKEKNGKKKSAGIRLTPEGASEGTPMTFADFKNNLPLLMAKNAEGFGIYAQPRLRGEVDGVRDVLLIDDIERPAGNGLEERTAENVAAFIATSDPNLYLRTSKAKTQALYALPLEPNDRDHDLRNAVLRRLNATFGDPAIARSGSIIHSFRLPGFLNHKKSAEAFPVQIIRPPHAGASVWAQEQIRAEAQRRLARRSTSSPVAPSTGDAWWTKERKAKDARETTMLQELAAGPTPSPSR